MTAPFQALDIPVEAIFPDPDQPRKRFEGLQALAATIKIAGIIQPILVRAHPDGIQGKWMIILGERRWRAAKLAGLSSVQAIDRSDITDSIALFQLIENLADYRHPLEAYEKALAVERFVKEECGGSIEKACEILGQNKDWFSRETALTRVTDDIWKFAEQNQISDKRTILDLSRLCKHTGRAVEDEWANINQIGKPKREALHARMEASGAKKKRQKKDESAAPADEPAPAAAYAGTPAQPSATREDASSTIKITPIAPIAPARFKRRGLEARLRKAGELLGIDAEKDFEGLLEALLKPVVPEEMPEMTFVAT